MLLMPLCHETTLLFFHAKGKLLWIRNNLLESGIAS